MKRLRISPDLLVRAAFAAFAGILWALAFPNVGVAGLAWIAPGLVLFSALGESPGGAFRLGYIAGLCHFLLSLNWLLRIPVPVAPIVGWLALSAFMALYPAVWVWLTWKWYPAALADPRSLQPFARLAALLDAFLATSWLARARWAFGSAALWVALEMVRARFLSGFPWNPLGASQFGLLPVIQMASSTGVYGVSFLLVWFSVALMKAAAALVRQPQRKVVWSAELILPALCAISVVIGGMQQIFHAKAAGRSVRLALIQPSIPQQTIWDPAESGARLRALLELTHTALSNQVDLVVWPEAAVPGVFCTDTNQVERLGLYRGITGLAKRYRVWMLIGADGVAPDAGARDGEVYFNSSFLINPAGDVVAEYRKQRLVIFGEYVPLARWLPFLRDFASVPGDFQAGTRPVPFPLADLGVTASVLICFEDVFPHGARTHVGPETDFLVNITNDGWFGRGSAQWQQAGAAVFRALENGVPLVRCSNNGITCWIDPVGRLHDPYLPGTTDVYGEGIQYVNLPLPPAGARRETVYHRYGDWFGWGCVGVSVVGILGARMRRRSGRGTDASGLRPAVPGCS